MNEYLEEYARTGIRKGQISTLVYACMDRKILDSDDKNIAYVGISKEREFLLAINPTMIYKIAIRMQELNGVKDTNTTYDHSICNYFDSVFTFILMHEFFHIALNHIQRGQKMENCSHLAKNWAADFAVNSLLLSSDTSKGIKPAVEAPLILNSISNVLNLGLLIPGSYISDCNQIIKSSKALYDGEILEVNQVKSLQNFMYRLPERESFDYYLIKVLEYFKNNNIESDSNSSSTTDTYKNGKGVLSGMQDLPTEIIDNDGNKVELDDSDIDNAVKKIKNRLKKLIEGRSKSIGNTSGGITWLTDWLFKEIKIPWDQILCKTLSIKLSPSKFTRTFSAPSRRRTNGIVRKGVQRVHEKELFVILDTSGSMGKEDYAKFVGVLKNLVKKGYEGQIMQWDYSLQKDPEDIKTFLRRPDMQLNGAGGTSMIEAICYVAKNYPTYQTILVVTDGGTPMFNSKNKAPVESLIWLITTTLNNNYHRDIEDIIIEI